MHGFFVTGTGTGVGKTVVAAAIASAAAATGRSVAVFKPAVSGLDEDGEPDHELLRRAARSAQSDDEIAPYRYGPPVSPHLAAELAGEPIEPGRLRAAAAAAARGAEMLVVEGVGGLMVPLAPDYLVRNLAAELALPVVVAASPGLGTINHTLLSLEAAWAAELEVAAVVLTPWPQDPNKMHRSNRGAIESFAGVDVLVLPLLALDDPTTWPALALEDAVRK